jgi:hypothetical protein
MEMTEKTCFDCGAPVGAGARFQHEFGCDGSPNCGCELTAYCITCVGLAKARAAALLEEFNGNRPLRNRADRRRALREARKELARRRPFSI